MKMSEESSITRSSYRIAALDWIHDEIIDSCETVDEVRDAIVNETIKLTKEQTNAQISPDRL